ncbi:MAG: hypothetical protein L6Q40_11690 [Azonexus sp.]|nr:hypothetical protein [Azonexus sp.]
MLEEKKKEEKKSWMTPVIHFAAHVVVGTALFVIIGAPAVGLSFLVKALVAAGVDAYTVAVLSFLEHAILTLDAILFMTYLVVTAWRSLKEMIEK